MIEKEELYSIIPHRGKMMLLTRINEYNLEERSVDAEYHITEDCIFYNHSACGVPVWAGFEFAAQAIAVLSGLEGRAKGAPAASASSVKPKMGYILSVSSMKIMLPFFKKNSTAHIKVKEIERMDSVLTFNCIILLEGQIVLQGKLMAMELEDEETQKQIMENRVEQQ